MIPGRSPLVVALHHPTEIDVPALRTRLADLPREIDLRVVPYREKVKLRRARQAPPVDPALLELAPRPDEDLFSAWREAEVIVTLDLPAERLAQMQRLAWVQAYSAGLEHLPGRALADRGIRLTSAVGVGAPAIAEFVFGRLVEVFRNLRAIDKMQQGRAFHRSGGRTLAGRTLGIVGLGAIGSEVARLGRAFGLRTLATRRSARRGDTSAKVDRLLPASDLDTLLAESDVVVLCAPATPETTDLIDTAALARCRPGAVLCNVARGALVDEQALCQALVRGRLGAAILDVTRREPLPPDDPLWSVPNLYLSPHCSIPPDAYDARLLDLFVENLDRYVRGDPLENEVDLAALPSPPRDIPVGG